MNNPEKNLAKNTFFLYLMQIANYVFPLLTFPYLTRVLGAEKYGVVVFGNAVMQYFTLCIEFGFLLSATNECSLSHNDKYRLSEITFGVIHAKLIIGFFGFVFLFCLSSFVSSFSDIKVFFYLSYIAIMLTVFLPDFLFRGIEKMSILTYRVLFSKIVYTILIFLLVHKPKNYIFIPVATIGGNCIAVFLTWFEIYKKKYIFYVRVGFKQTFLYLKGASSFFLSRVAVTIFSSLNTVLLGTKFPSNELGQYGSANTLCQTCKGMMTPIGDGIYPYMVKNKNFGLVKKLILILEPLIIVGCVVMYFLSSWVIRIICGEGYENAVPIFRTMLPYVAIGLPNTLLGYPVLGAIGNIKIANTSIIYASIVHLVGLGILYFSNLMNFSSVVFLTFCTELLILLIRCAYILHYKKNLIADKKIEVSHE